MNFKEVTAEDLFGKGVTGLPDTPGLSTTDMQAKFDELVKDVMVPKRTRKYGNIHPDRKCSCKVYRRKRRKCHSRRNDMGRV